MSKVYLTIIISAVSSDFSLDKESQTPPSLSDDRDLSTEWVHNWELPNDDPDNKHLGRTLCDVDFFPMVVWMPNFIGEKAHVIHF
jgi:hypothetical protein